VYYDDGPVRRTKLDDWKDKAFSRIKRLRKTHPVLGLLAYIAAGALIAAGAALLGILALVLVAVSEGAGNFLLSILLLAIVYILPVLIGIYFLSIMARIAYAIIFKRNRKT